MARALKLPAWPGDASVAVSLTFDVDGDPSWLGMKPDAVRQLSTLSQFRYGIVRGLPRVLTLLETYKLPATFYVPGATAIRYRNQIERALAAGHELAHHGHHHLRPDSLQRSDQRLEVERGLAAIQAITGTAPDGYRAPCAELTPETLELLDEFGFRYDSSCMGDDRPYIEEVGAVEILEFPLHWSLDDAPYFLYTLDDEGQLRDPTEVFRIWMSEFHLALAENRHVTYVMHPEIIGRGAVIGAFEAFVAALRDRSDVWFCTHRELADLLLGEP